MIPSIAHFIWFGRDIHWVHLAAIRTAALNGGFARVLLHHDHDLSGHPHWHEVAGLPNVECHPIDMERTLLACGPDGRVLADIARTLRKPAARANMLRAALLHLHGGVYLDTDTVTLRPMDDLRASFGAFCGDENVVFPRALLAERKPLPMAAAYVRTAARDVFRLLPDGWRSFRAVAPLYARAANNAVLAARPGHGLPARLLAGMASLPPERIHVRFALGTHLLQDTLAAHREPDLWVAPPAVFYPLGPEISAHWFRPTRRVDLTTMVLPETRVVHWYASVRADHLVPTLDRAWVRTNAATIPLAALFDRCLDGDRTVHPPPRQPGPVRPAAIPRRITTRGSLPRPLAQVDAAP